MRIFVIFIFLSSLCLAQNASFKPKSDIAQYLELDIKRKNPFEAFKPLSDSFGIPLPSLNNEMVVNAFQTNKQTAISKDFNFKRDSVFNTYVLGAGFKHISTLLEDYVKEILKNKDNVINVEMHLNGVVTREESGVGGDVNLLYRVHKDKINTFELLGGFNRNLATQMWGGSYGAKHKIQHELLKKLYFEQSFVQNNDLIDERTWKYGLGYSPFRNFKTYIEREDNKESEDSTKAGMQYKITF